MQQYWYTVLSSVQLAQNKANFHWCLVTEIVEEDQITTSVRSPEAFIRHLLFTLQNLCFGIPHNVTIACFAFGCYCLLQQNQCNFAKLSAQRESESTSLLYVVYFHQKMGALHTIDKSKYYFLIFTTFHINCEEKRYCAKYSFDHRSINQSLNNGTLHFPLLFLLRTLQFHNLQ